MFFLIWSGRYAARTSTFIYNVIIYKFFTLIFLNEIQKK